ncbi:MAG: CRTAC1 family protein [Acidobacteriaceae bacterium]
MVKLQALLLFAAVLATGNAIRAQAAPTRTAASTSEPLAQPSVPHFRDVAAAVGLRTVPHTKLDRRAIIETMSGGGVAFLDCDNDGKLDIAVVNDSSIDGYLAGGDPMITLYHQDGAGKTLHFTDITKAAGLTTKGWANGIAVADYDNDGLPDIFVTGYGHNVLYHNLGGCRFEDVTAKAGVAGGGFSVGAAWADYDHDGFVDLFVSRYVDTDPRHLPTPNQAVYKGTLTQLPDAMHGETDLLYHNRGDGTFEEVAAKAGVENQEKAHGMGVLWGDFSGDGWPDLFVTNDGSLNFLFQNHGNGTFEEIGLSAGVGAGDMGQIYGNMAGDAADIDHNGRLDLFVTRFAHQPASLYMNDGNETFHDAASEAGIAVRSTAPVKWGTNFADFDNSGWQDILMASGNFSSLLDKEPGEPPFGEPIELFLNRTNGTFKEVGDATALNSGPLQSRRGTAVGDVNNDGKLDILVFNVGAPPSLFVNETRNDNHWITLRLMGTKSNRMAIGARVTVTTGSIKQMAEVRSGSSYLSSSDPRLHFGVGSAGKIDRIEVAWPSGLTESFQNVAVDRFLTLREGTGSALPANAPGTSQR